MFDRYITFRAQLTPGAVAVVTNGGDLRYGQLDANINRVVAALEQEGMPEGGLVAVRIADALTHWLVLLALARMGVASASFGSLQNEAILEVLSPDLVITDAPHLDDGPPDNPRRLLKVNAEWEKHVLAQSPNPRPRKSIAYDALGRVITSSGTTGIPKKLAYSWRKIENGLGRSALLAGITGAMERTLSLIGVESGSFFGTLGCWAAGGAAIFTSSDVNDLARRLHALAPTTLMAAPVQLRLLLAALPPGFVPLSEMLVAVTGSHTPVQLQRAIRLRLAPQLTILYASSEAGLIASAYAAQVEHDPTAVGWVSPTAQVEVVDDNDAPLGHNRIGHIRARAGGAATEYMDDPDASAKYFRHGWFYPGDIGALAPDGLLRVLGRSDDVINLGGEKLLPRVVEDAATACPGVLDAAVFTLPDADGLPIIWLAVVRGEGLDEAKLTQALQLPGVPEVKVAWVEKIPRNGLGKIQRDQLRAGAAALGATVAGAVRQRGKRSQKR